jgi:hypothetical protein
MPSDTDILAHLYDRFNARDMEAVLRPCTETSYGPTAWRAAIKVRMYWCNLILQARTN